MEMVSELANPNVQIVRATAHIIGLIFAGKMGILSPREQQRRAVAIATHAISAARRDEYAAKVLAGRFRSARSFAVRASQMLFGQQSVAKHRLFALAIQRIAKDQLDNKSTLALLTEVGLVNFGRGFVDSSSDNRSLSASKVTRMTSFLGTFMQHYPRQPILSPNDFDAPATLLLVHKSESGDVKAVTLTDDLERIYNAARAARLPAMVSWPKS